MVAKSYQDWATYGEPFEENGKKYIVVITPKGAHKKVRFYNETEYAKLYPEEPKVECKRLQPRKDVLGFSKGYITIFKGDTYPLLEWFQQSPCRYHMWWGWYLISDEEDLEWPAGITDAVLVLDKENRISLEEMFSPFWF